MDWNPRTEANFTVLCDACPLGMGFWVEHLLLGLYSAVPANAPNDTIFFWEATWFCQRWNGSALAVEPAYNILLKAAVDLLIQYNVDLRVLHIRGDDNTIADAISRANFSLVHSLRPDLEITPFQPPQCVLGAAEK
ncbi:hypothetical protein B0H13DRAFT_2374352 [Mycena leptocephala]|nr:hypothetical protein B0H13DRAFT_2374352 [Mycena leptocephala]